MGISSLEDRVFENCISLEKVILPESLTLIGKNAFASCKSLKDINVPDGLEEIQSSAFAKCEELTEIILPENTEKIGGNAFNNCKSSCITVKGSSIEIGKHAFKKVLTVRIPQSVLDSLNVDEEGFQKSYGGETLEITK